MISFSGLYNLLYSTVPQNSADLLRFQNLYIYIAALALSCEGVD
jgi:hypothetical protein